MKDFNDFIATLDSNYFDKLEKVLNERPEIINAPTESAKIRAESSVIAMLLIGKYHEWLQQ